ncbi:MAG: hypothetical protein U0736_11725 [Gemmataceae bacterium]
MLPVAALVAGERVAAVHLELGRLAEIDPVRVLVLLVPTRSSIPVIPPVSSAVLSKPSAAAAFQFDGHTSPTAGVVEGVDPSPTGDRARDRASERQFVFAMPHEHAADDAAADKRRCRLAAQVEVAARSAADDDGIRVRLVSTPPLTLPAASIVT